MTRIFETRNIEKRHMIYSHNALQGGVAMAQANMNRIIQHSLATDKSKMLAKQVNVLLEDLRVLVKERKK